MCTYINLLDIVGDITKFSLGIYPVVNLVVVSNHCTGDHGV